MKTFQRSIGILFLLALAISPFGSYAQDDENTIMVVGSGIVTPLFELLANASDAEATIETNINGTNAGFAEFCAGEADITTATRPITVDEETTCLNNGVEYDEFLLGHNILTFVVNSDFDTAQCLDLSAINGIFAPSSTGVIDNWNDLGIFTAEDADADPEEAPLSLYVPAENTALYVMLDDFVEGVGLRTDVNVETSEADIIAAVAAERTALGVVSLSAVTDDVRAVDVNTDINLECFSPSAENVENRLYTSADRLFVYVNRASQEKAGLTDALNFATSPDASELVTEAGFTPPSEDAYATNTAILAGEEDGRQFSLEVVAFEIPANLFGTVGIGGTAIANNYVNAVTGAFTTQYPSVTIESQTLGEPAGLRRFCNGEIDMAITTAPLSGEDAENCEANNVVPLDYMLGSLAVVLVGNASADYQQCLTVEQLQTIWGSSADTDLAENWNAISDDFPDVPMTLFATDNTDVIYTDLLLTPAEGAVIPLRTDVETDNDPLYRAAATANVEGGITYMSWADYQSVLENEQENIQLLSVSNGTDCIEPSEDTIADGTYPLTRDVYAIVSQPSLARPEVQSLLWFMFSDANYTALQNNELYGLEISDLIELRESLQENFAEAQVAALEVGAEATPEPETTPEAEATPETTPETEGSEDE